KIRQASVASAGTERLCEVRWLAVTLVGRCRRTFDSPEAREKEKIRVKIQQEDRNAIRAPAGGDFDHWTCSALRGTSANRQCRAGITCCGEPGAAGTGTAGIEVERGAGRGGASARRADGAAWRGGAWIPGRACTGFASHASGRAVCMALGKRSTGNSFYPRSIRVVSARLRWYHPVLKI